MHITPRWVGEFKMFFSLVFILFFFQDSMVHCQSFLTSPQGLLAPGVEEG